MTMSPSLSPQESSWPESKAVIRRVNPTGVDDLVEVQGLRLDPVSHRVTCGDDALDMGPTEIQAAPLLYDSPRACV